MAEAWGRTVLTFGDVLGAGVALAVELTGRIRSTPKGAHPSLPHCILHKTRAHQSTVRVGSAGETLERAPGLGLMYVESSKALTLRIPLTTREYERVEQAHKHQRGIMSCCRILSICTEYSVCMYCMHIPMNISDRGRDIALAPTFYHDVIS